MQDWLGYLPIPYERTYISKTRLFKYIENFTTKNWKFSDKNSDIFMFLLKTLIVGTR